MKKYKEIITEQAESSLSSSLGDLSSIQTSFQDLSSFGAGKQTLTSLSATQAQAPLQTAYASGTRKGSAITQYKQGNVKSQKNYLTTNVVGKKRPVRDEDDEDAITRPDLTFVPSSIEKLPTTPFTSRDLDDAIKSGDVSRIAQTLSGEYAGAAYRRKDLLKGVFKSILGIGEGSDPAGRVLQLTDPFGDDPRSPEEKTYEEQMDDFINASVEEMVPRISFGIANALSGLYFKIEDYEAQRKQTREYLEFVYGDGDGDGIPGLIEVELNSPEFLQTLQNLLSQDPEYLSALGVNVDLLQQFIELAYVGDPFTAGNYPPEFVQLVRFLFGLDEFGAPDIGGNGRPPSDNGNGLPPTNPGSGSPPTGPRG